MDCTYWDRDRELFPETMKGLVNELRDTRAALARVRAAMEEAQDEILYWRSLGYCYEEGWSRVLARIDGIDLKSKQ